MSKLIAGFSYVVPGAMTPGHCISMGTRIPPSKVSHFEPRRGVLIDPLTAFRVVGPPLSLVKTMSVWSSSPASSSSVSTRPMASSIALSMAA
jgi:hypothetical protein